MCKYLIYPTDLTDCQWALIRDLLPKPKSGPGKRGRPLSDLRLVVNAIFYINKTGAQWEMLPHELGNHNAVYGHFNRWSRERIWQNILDELASLERGFHDKKAEPSGACIDSQSVKTTTQSVDVGFDGGKKVKGRKRHILTDTLGILLTVVVTAANKGDREGLTELLTKYFESGKRRLRKLWVDSVYFGKQIAKWVGLLKKTNKVELEVVEKEGKGFNVVKKRWVVERTFSWLFNYRRNSKDYEILTRNSESMLKISMIQILLHHFP